ncbi:MAG: HAD-IB family phosphatase [Candidatus Limnocylindrales bacterium]
MTEASDTPTFDPDGAPVSVLLDFDGTISLDDTGDTLLARLFEDRELTHQMDQLYLSGEKGSRELIAWDMEVLPRDPAVLWTEIDTLPLDETLTDLLAQVREARAAAEVVSDGTGFHVEYMLERLGVTDLPVATNRTVLGAGGAGVSFPYGHPDCYVCGTCKRERIRLHRDAGRAVVFVGDGPSDRYAAHHADVIFAKASLAGWCEVENIPYEPWERLADVAEWLELALLDGRLPASAAVYPDWATAARPEVESFICGPEVWGPGRTVAGRAPGSSG